jgi:hypothetical protein
VRIALDPALDDRAGAWLSQYIVAAGRMAGRELSLAQVEHEVAATSAIGGPITQRRKSVRCAYLGDVLLHLEARGLLSWRARELAPWIARGAPLPRPFLPALSRGQRRGAIGKRRLLESELRAAELRPEPEPRLPSQQEREASQARERQRRKEHDERGREMKQRWSLASKQVRVEYAGKVLAGIAVKLLRNEAVPGDYVAEAEELTIALARLKRLDPQRREVLQRVSHSDGASVRTSADQQHIESCFAWLVACTDAAREVVEGELGVRLPLVSGQLDRSGGRCRRPS